MAQQQFFKLHDNGKVCKVLAVETNTVGGQGFDAFVQIEEPDYLGVQGYNWVKWVAAYRGEFVESPEATPVAEVAESAFRLVGPTWTDKQGSHATAFHRINCAPEGEPKREAWQLVDYCDGVIFRVVDMPHKTSGVCDTATGALWALRGIAAQWMRDDVRSTRGH